MVSARQCRFLSSGKIPGIVIPPEISKKISSYKNTAEQVRAGMKVAMELATEIAPESKSIHLIMPFHKDTVRQTADLVRLIREQSGPHIETTL